ncbi:MULTISPECIES: non-ribosomal peptide synthetase [unclassified Streptomyces]|uniref:non-ribosomal peptide synthetase n=1 Tax=Streptomyces TaxID=1883 RepID=UPI0008048297|nr:MULTISPECIES: non-ribosomal peptide synthetase [unclassified Streptomyces]MYR72849.1 amino acid adenylation domain-containing protein [Streptomyces sp. SID4925]SBU95505.1 amino acid adenylation domain-containing protein [Streptomyces sp. OspMP-M45]
MNTVSELFESVVTESGDAPAVVFGESVLDYAELNARANRLARRLIAAGVGPDALVAVAVPRSARLVVAVLAVLKAGGAYLPLDPDYPAERLTHMVVDARPVLLLRTDGVTSLHLDVPELVLDDPSFEALCERERGDDIAAGERTAPLVPAHLMYVIYTSGSTGVPKGVAVSHTGVTDLVSTQVRLYGVGRGDRILQWASFSFDAWFWDFALALLNGATLVMAEQHALMPGESLRETMLTYSIDHAVLPPVALGITDSEGLLVGGTITSTGDVCTRALAEEWSKGRRLYNAYGPTEVTVGASIGGPVKGVQDEVTVGTPWDGGVVHVLDERLRECPDGQEGELFLAGSGVVRGYLNRPGLTASRFVADPYGPPGSRMYRSGDRGRHEADGELYFTGRIDNQVKMRGFRVELGEIETRLESHPAVEIVVAVVGGQDAATEHIVAYVRTSDRHEVTEGQLRAHARDALPEHMVPTHVVVLDRFPTLPNGKIDRKELAERAVRGPAGGHGTPPDPAPAAGEGGAGEAASYEEVLCRMVGEILQVPEVTPKDNFFDLGGHSMLAAKLAGRMRKELGVTVPMRSMFEAQSLAELAQVMERVKRG